jgi:hypothetical protein
MVLGSLTKPFWRSREAICRQARSRPDPPDMVDLDPTTRFGHVGIHHQLILPPVLQDIAVRHSQPEPNLGSMRGRPKIPQPVIWFTCATGGLC